MPFLHLDANNRYKEEWKTLIKDHPEGFEVLEWNYDQDKAHLFVSCPPELDMLLYPKSVISITAALQKLLDYGGIVVRGEETKPIRGIKIVLEDWKTLGPPKRLSVRGWGYPTAIDKTTIMVAKEGDPTCKKYRDKIVETMLIGKWIHPEFMDDVALI
jgi:hypothetical protein